MLYSFKTQTQNYCQPRKSSGYILGQVWEDIQSRKFAALLQAWLLVPRYLTSEGNQTLELPSPAFSLRAWTSDRQGSVGVSKWGNSVSQDVRVQWQGALRQCRSGFSFGYRQKCCSCIEGCCDDRGSCDFLCSSEVPGIRFLMQKGPGVLTAFLCKLDRSKRFHIRVLFFSVF